MKLLLELVIINSIWTLGLTISSQEGMLLGGVKGKMEGKFWGKPILTCIYCMPSIHSLFAYSFAVGMGLITAWSFGLLVILPLVVCGASLLNGFIWYLLNLLIKKVEYYEWLQELDQNKKGES